MSIQILWRTLIFYALFTVHNESHDLFVGPCILTLQRYRRVKHIYKLRREVTTPARSMKLTAGLDEKESSSVTVPTQNPQQVRFPFLFVPFAFQYFLHLVDRHNREKQGFLNKQILQMNVYIFITGFLNESAKGRVIDQNQYNKIYICFIYCTCNLVKI